MGGNWVECLLPRLTSSLVWNGLSGVELLDSKVGWFF